MIDRYLLRIVIVLSFLLGLFSPGLEAQEREEVYPKELLNVIMRGAGDPPALPSLDASYCSDDGPIDIYVEETLPPNVTTIQWTVQVNMGGTLVAVSDYHESIGSLPNLGIRLFPDRFSEEHLNRSILISYNIVSGSGSSGKGDYTHVLKKPTVYNLSIEGFEAEVDGEICIEKSVTLILDGSEVGVNYFLQRDGVNINPFPQEGTGGALSWTNISVGGEYSVLAVNSRSFQFGPDVTHNYQCSSVMNETPFLTVHPLPVPTANSDKSTYCVGEPIQLSGGPDGMASYSWAYPDGAIVEERNPLIASADYSSHNGTYTLTVESADGCINTTTLNVVVNENPTATLPADFDVCEDAPLNFTTTVTGGAGPYSYAWTKDGNPIGTTTASISVPSASLGDAGVYEVTVTDANGCGAATASISIGVNERPVIGAVSNDGPACEGESIQLSSSGVTGVGILSYAWTSPNGYSSSDENPLIDPVTLADGGVYTLVVRDASGCSSDHATTTVVVDALPEATLSGNAAVCVGATASYTAGGGDFYTFTVLDALSNVEESQARSATNTFETSALAVGSYTIQVRVENAAGCTAEESVTLTVNAAPEATIAFDPAVICKGESSQLVVELTTAAPWSISYYDGSSVVSRSGITGLTHREEVNHTSNVTYTLLSITDANGCTVNPNTTATLTVNERPSVSVESDKDPSNLVCLGNDMLLMATASGGAGNYVYQWTHNGVVLPGATGATYTISNAEITDAGEYSVVVTDTDNGHACESAPASLTVVVTEAVAGLSGSGEICAGTSEEYTATGGISYLFELLDAADAVIGTRAWDSDATYSTDLALAVGTYTLRVTVKDANGCQAQSELPIEVKESPDNTLTYSATDICSGESITVSAVSGYSTYIFYVNEDEVQNGPDHEYTSSTFVDSDVVKAEIILGACSTESAEQTISVRPSPVVELVSDQPDNVACPGETVLLTASGADHYAFEVNGVQVQAPGATATYSAVFADGDQIIVYGEAANACVSSDTLSISVTPVATLELSSAELCVNEVLTLTAGGGVQYEFFRNGVSLGDAGSASTFEVIDPADGDEFSVTVINQYGCETSASAPAVVVHDLPTPTLSSDHSEFCSDTEVTFTAGGGNVFAFYRERGGIVGLVQESSSSTYSASDFEDGDQVFVVVTDANDCSATSSSIALTVWPLPEAGITVSPQYAGEGDNVTIAGGGGEDYLFLVNGEPYDGDFEGWIAGPLTLNTLVNGDELSVIARNEFGCIAESETITMTIDAYPIEFDLLPVSSKYCENDGGATLYLVDHEPLTSVEYELFEVNEDNDLIGPAGITPIEDGNFLIWTGVTEGSYKVVARRLPGGLEKEFTAVAEVRMNDNPLAFDLIAVENPTICEVSISLSGSEAGVNYYLQLDGDGLLEDPIEGDGSFLDFGSFSSGGTYSILAVSDKGCRTEMNNPYLKEVTPNSPPFTVSSDPVDGSYCEGSEGVTLQTDGSEDGAAYQVYYYEKAIGESVLGTGNPLSFGPYTNEGIYRVEIAGVGGCLYVLKTPITVSKIPLPDPVTLSAENEGHFCEGDTEDVALTQTGFQAGVTYALYYEGGLVTDSEWTASNTDVAGLHPYGAFSQAGTYTIKGTTILGGCSPQQVAEMELVADPLPTAFEVEGEGFYCGPTGKTFITLSGSETSVSYQLMLNNDVEVGTPQPGTGLPLSFEVNEEGVYTVLASRSTCSQIMTGDVPVVMRDLPDTDIDVAPIDDNDADCTTGVTIELERSQAGVLYELYFVDNGTYISTGNTVYGDENGGPVQFPNPVIDGGGEYIVQAMLDGCPAFIEPKFEIDIDDVPRRFALIGSGDVCEGEDGADLWLSGSEDNVSYELWARHGVSPVQTVTFPHADFDTGEAFPFNKVVDEGAYYVRAVSGNDASCAVTTYEDLEVRFHKLPDAYQFTGAQVFCGTAEGEGAVLKLNDSEAGVVYSLMRRVEGDFTLFVDSKDGNDGPLEFSEVFTEGIYRVYARNTLTGCTSSMNGTVEVEHRDAPGDFELISSVGTVNDGDVLDKCYGDNSFSLMVSNSQPGVLYRLYRKNNDGEKQLRATVEGNGEVVHFNNEVQWPRGTYFVEPTFASTACVGPMVEFFIEYLYGPHDNDDRPLIIDYIGGRIKVIHPVPALATYELYMGNEHIESFITNEPFQEVAWTVNDPGNYHVEAYSEDRPACINKSNTITITDVTPPVAEYWLVDPVLEYCSGDAGGIDVVLTGTTAGVYYELVKLDDDNPEVIQIKKGITDGGDVVFNGVEGTHRYSIWVDGSDEYFIDTDDKTFVVTENTTPSSFLLSRGGAVNSHEITLSGSEKDVWYWLIRNGNFDFEEMPLVGTDSILNFGTVNKPGDYFVIAFGEGGCEAEMEGMANIYQSELVAVNDTLYLSPDDLAGTLDLAENDRFSFIGGLDRYSTAGDGNLRFRIVRPAKSGAETSLNEFSGMLSYSKLPSFYGEDFLEYRIENLDVPGRESGIGRVVIMVGNKDFNENQSFLLPNAFSPNGDGINDRFVISGLGETEESTLEVFNRWGTIVYRSQGKQYDNSWDGTSNVGAMVSIGKELPNGVYFYVYSVKKNVNGSIQTRNYSGYVELRR